MFESKQELKKQIETNPYLRSDLEFLEKEMKKDELGADLKKIEKLISKSKAENKEGLLKLVENIDKAAERYITAIIETFQVSERLTSVFHLDEEKYGQLIYTKDSEQKRAHEVLIDSIQILLRNCFKKGIDAGEIVKKYIGSKENIEFRGKIRELAIFHIYSIISEEKR